MQKSQMKAASKPKPPSKGLAQAAAAQNASKLNIAGQQKVLTTQSNATATPVSKTDISLAESAKVIQMNPVEKHAYFSSKTPPNDPAASAKHRNMLAAMQANADVYKTLTPDDQKLHMETHLKSSAVQKKLKQIILRFILRC